MNAHPIRILIGSPIRQKPDILEEFLQSIQKLSTNNKLMLNYYFIDDNEDHQSSDLLLKFKQENNGTTITTVSGKTKYVCNEDTHFWEEDLIWQVANFKNRIIEKAIQADYDYLFLIDSDIIIHPRTLEHLAGLNKDIIAEIFWTIWEPGFPPLPQVWVSDQYNLYEKSREENLTDSEILDRVQTFLAKLKKPGVYEVGGLGACTLISKKALQAGVNFKEINNLSLVGEDRHFCIRAVALGFKLYVDTQYPAYHIYRPSDLVKVKEFKEHTRTKQ